MVSPELSSVLNLLLLISQVLHSYVVKIKVSLNFARNYEHL